jgi:hypothetical protein
MKILSILSIILVVSTIGYAQADDRRQPITQEQYIDIRKIWGEK